MQINLMPDFDDLLIEKVNNLPSLSPVVQRIGTVMADPKVSASDIVDVLKTDPAIASKVLRLANSAYIGIPRTVSSLQNAVVILGQRRIHSLVLAASSLSIFKLDSALPFDRMDFWKHSVTVAIVCESIARYLKRYDPVEAGEIFCAGMLHDIGKLVLAVYDPDRIVAVYKEATELKKPFFSVEGKKTSHVRIGAFVAERWNFPENLISAIMYHHTPAYTERFKKIISIVHLSDIIVHIVGVNTVPKEIASEIDEDTMAEVGLSPESLKVIADNALKSEKQLESLIDFFS